MLIEVLSLHRRFLYAVLSGWIILDKDAASDDIDRRRSTLENKFPRLRLFTGRHDPRAARNSSSAATSSSWTSTPSRPA